MRDHTKDRKYTGIVILIMLLVGAFAVLTVFSFYSNESLRYRKVERIAYEYGLRDITVTGKDRQNLTLDSSNFRHLSYAQMYSLDAQVNAGVFVRVTAYTQNQEDMYQIDIFQKTINKNGEQICYWDDAGFHAIETVEDTADSKPAPDSYVPDRTEEIKPTVPANRYPYDTSGYGTDDYDDAEDFAEENWEDFSDDYWGGYEEAEDYYYDGY